MKILALETSAKAVSAAVVEDGVPLASAYQNLGLTHSVTLMPLVDTMLKNAGLQLQDIGCVAVAHGPGSFTGLRIGVSAAKGLAWTLDVPCCGVSTLEGMAQNAAMFNGLIICAMDARRSQIYHALFSCKNGVITRVSSDRAIGLDELCKELQPQTDDKMVVGDGASLCHTYLTEHGIDCRLAPPESVMQNAVGVGLVACRMAAKGETISPRDLVPIYLRLSQAERERLAKGLKITVD